MLKIGVIGCGNRIQTMLQRMAVFEIPFQVVAVADPKWEEIQKVQEPWYEGCRFFPDAATMIQQADHLDGIMVGSPCFLHTEHACQAAVRNVPLFVEKPVSISFAQVRQLADTFADYRPPVVVSFPLRVTHQLKKVKELLDQDTIGPVKQMIAFNDVPYGRGYYVSWYRDLEKSGGLWMQKATHDLDYLNYLAGDQKAVGIFAMQALQVYGGQKDNDLRCSQCPEISTCPESSFNLFYQQMRSKKPTSRGDRCCFARKNNDHDTGHALMEYADGLQVNYTQNFFARHKSAKRGARIYGYKGIIEFDWYANKITIFSHRLPTVSTVEFPYFEHHWGGDRELCHDWLMAMKEQRPSRCPMSTGIASALACLWARQSAATRQYCRIELPPVPVNSPPA